MLSIQVRTNHMGSKPIKVLYLKHPNHQQHQCILYFTIYCIILYFEKYLTCCVQIWYIFVKPCSSTPKILINLFKKGYLKYFTLHFMKTGLCMISFTKVTIRDSYYSNPIKNNRVMAVFIKINMTLIR